LQSEWPFRIFASVNEAFAALPIGSVTTLLKPENKTALTGILTYHVVAEPIDSKSLIGMIKNGGGKYNAKTVNGATLTFTTKGMNVIVSDESGNMAKAIIAVVYQSNGIIHVIDHVPLPK